MAPRSQSNWTRFLPVALQRLVAPLTGSGRTLLAIAILVVIVCVGFYVGWAKWGGMIRAQPQYRLATDSFEVTPQPDWIQSDVKGDVIRDGDLTQLSVLDPDLTKNVVQAFELHTWVAKVLWCGKRPGKDGPRVIVELQYRQPIIMVRARDDQWEGDCFWPVDTEGVFLPPDEFSRSQTERYLRVDAAYVPPMGAVGTPYGDAGVAGAARVAAGIGAAWESMGLQWIVVRKDMRVSVGQPPKAAYVLLPAGGDPDRVARRPAGQLTSMRAEKAETLEVIWGHAPGHENQDEATADQKVMRLQMFVNQNGSLDQLPPSTVIDLRPRAAMSVVNGQALFQPASVR